MAGLLFCLKICGVISLSWPRILLLMLVIDSSVSFAFLLIASGVAMIRMTKQLTEETTESKTYKKCFEKEQKYLLEKENNNNKITQYQQELNSNDCSKENTFEENQCCRVDKIIADMIVTEKANKRNLDINTEQRIELLKQSKDYLQTYYQQKVNNEDTKENAKTLEYKINQ